MNCISQFAKYVIFTINALIASCALALIVCGVMYMMKEKDGVNVFSIFGSVSIGIIVICVGVIILFIAGFGFCGALHQNTCLVTTYGLILIILFAVQLTIGILAVLKIVDQDDFLDYVKGLVQDIFDAGDTASLKTFYTLQKQFKCCGVNDYNDYNLEIDGYPKTCCKNEETPCFHPYTIGCSSAFSDAIKDYIAIIGYFAVGFAGVELIGAIFAFLIRRTNLQNELKFKQMDTKEEETSI